MIKTLEQSCTRTHLFFARPFLHNCFNFYALLFNENILEKQFLSKLAIAIFNRYSEAEHLLNKTEISNARFYQLSMKYQIYRFTMRIA